eukprot:TRINITY_DN279_c0_g1_i1.p1 TRINITY_DN279_c0_g1~~TRINITY_DN279_c0_g1_i1.p1  ORF type:complete len:133 (+),score=32.12 TRINITY_DN279_c0_g1_i1:68-466(+)
MSALKQYTAEEVAKHNSMSDAWIVHKGLVYDITKFLDSHPGGEDVLLSVAGREDSTSDFEDVGHSEEARNTMKEYLIGEILPSQKKAAAGAKSSAAVKSGSSAASAGGAGPSYALPLIVVGLALLFYYFYSS